MSVGSALAEAEANQELKPPMGAVFRQAASMIPHITKRDKGGEDAYVSREDLLVVADGVGGWAESGVDPGLFSKALVRLIEEQFVRNRNATLKQMLIESVKLNRHLGSSTAVLAALDVKQDQVIMRTCNLGDSGYVLFRAPSQPNSTERLEVVFRSKEQQYSFNFPYQCGTGCELPYAAYETTH